MTTNNNNKPIVSKIEFTEEQKIEMDNIKKGIRAPTTKIRTNKNGYQTEYQTSSKQPLSEMQRRDKLHKLYYGGTCVLCGQWPDYKVSYDRDGAKKIERYCLKHYHDTFIKLKKENQENGKRI